MANVSKLIFGAAIAAASMASPALAAHRGKPISAYQNGHRPGGPSVYNSSPAFAHGSFSIDDLIEKGAIDAMSFGESRLISLLLNRDS